jgi:hypothetical protein
MNEKSIKPHATIGLESKHNLTTGIDSLTGPQNSHQLASPQWLSAASQSLEEQSG